MRTSYFDANSEQASVRCGLISFKRSKSSTLGFRNYRRAQTSADSIKGIEERTFEAWDAILDCWS